MKTTFIYGLNDPETGECRYVGKSNNPKKRRWDHVSSNANYHSVNWIKSLKARGLKPLLEILQEVPFDDWKIWERVWIKASRLIGMKLTNHTDGGDGLCNPTPETRKKLAKFGKDHHAFGKPGFMLGKKHKPEALAKMSVARKGKKQTPEWIENARITRIGKKKSPKILAKLRVKKGGSSIFHGVHRDASRNKWGARIHFSCSSKYLGRFDNEIDAAKAYDAAAKIYHGEYATLNFP